MLYHWVPNSSCEVSNWVGKCILLSHYNPKDAWYTDAAPIMNYSVVVGGSETSVIFQDGPLAEGVLWVMEQNMVEAKGD